MACRHATHCGRGADRPRQQQGLSVPRLCWPEGPCCQRRLDGQPTAQQSWWWFRRVLRASPCTRARLVREGEDQEAPHRLLQQHSKGGVIRQQPVLVCPCLPKDRGSSQPVSERRCCVPILSCFFWVLSKPLAPVVRVMRTRRVARRCPCGRAGRCSCRRRCCSAGRGTGGGTAAAAPSSPAPATSPHPQQGPGQQPSPPPCPNQSGPPALLLLSDLANHAEPHLLVLEQDALLLLAHAAQHLHQTPQQ